MSGTIENTNNNIILKIKYIIYLLNIICDYLYNKVRFNLFLEKYEEINDKNDIFFTNDLNTHNNEAYIYSNILYEYSTDIFTKKNYDDDIKCIITSITDIKNEYELGSSNILSSYFDIKYQKKNLTGPSKVIAEKNSFNIYHNFINTENFISKINRLIIDIIKYTKLQKIEKNVLKIIEHVIYLFNNHTIQSSVKELEYDICECQNTMIIDSNISALVCESCGMIREMLGTVFEDEQFYYQEGQRGKHGTYDPSKHCKFWVERIQARENTEIPGEIIETIKKYIKRDKIKNKNHITCAMIRNFLRQSNNSRYNEHVPLIRKLITGFLPPQLTEHELQLINLFFDKVIFIFENIKPENKTNCPYHPYFIYKIIEQIIKDNNARKTQILSCIHLQSRETLICNDILWKDICKYIPEFSYIPTDRNN